MSAPYMPQEILDFFNESGAYIDFRDIPTVLPVRESIGHHTHYMKEVTDPDKIVEELDALRDGTLRGVALDRYDFTAGRTGTLFPKVEFDTLVATGFSGTLPLLYVAKKLDVKWLAVRKNGESTHTGMPIEGDLGRKWLFMDDFMSSGKTFAWTNHVVNDGAEKNQFKTENVGAYWYHNDPTYYGPKHRAVIEAMEVYSRGFFARKEDNSD